MTHLTNLLSSKTETIINLIYQVLDAARKDGYAISFPDRKDLDKELKKAEKHGTHTL